MPSKRVKISDRVDKACLQCRALKMRCVGAGTPPCRRCARTSTLCEFVPRANAAQPDDPKTYTPDWGLGVWKSNVERRLVQLEKALGTAHVVSPGGGDVALDAQDLAEVIHAEPIEADNETPIVVADKQVQQEPSLLDAGVALAVEKLLGLLPARLAKHPAWNHATLASLWTSFQNNMPGLHFLSGKVSLLDPSPLLAASIFFVSAAHYPNSDLASGQAVYLQAFSHAVGALAIVPQPPDPTQTTRGAHSSPGGPVERGAEFDDLLGIILAGLLALGWVDTVGIWVSIAHRLFLDGVTEDKGHRIAEWRGLWEGLRTIELEHSSLHLTSLVIPVELPPSILPQFAKDKDETAGTDIGALLLIMQRRIKRFMRRGLCSPWDRVCGTVTTSDGVRFDGDDLGELKAWAGEVDDWYGVHSARTAQSSHYVRAIIVLNYHLHKIFVLSLFLPTRQQVFGQGHPQSGLLISNELLESCRLALAVEQAGLDVWSNWDLVMMTAACLFLIEAVETSRGQPKDLELVQTHLRLLRSTHQTPPSLRHTLAEKLDASIRPILAIYNSLIPSLSSGHASTTAGVPPPQTLPSQVIQPTTLRINTNPQSNLLTPPLGSSHPQPAWPMAGLRQADWDYSNVQLFNRDVTFTVPPQIAPPPAAPTTQDGGGWSIPNMAWEGEGGEWPSFLVDLFGGEQASL